MAITVYINGKREEADGPTTLSELLSAKKIRPEVVTVAVNKTVLKREGFEAASLADGDEVEIMLHLAGGDR